MKKKYLKFTILYAFVNSMLRDKIFPTYLTIQFTFTCELIDRIPSPEHICDWEQMLKIFAVNSVFNSVW